MKQIRGSFPTVGLVIATMALAGCAATPPAPPTESMNAPPAAQAPTPTFTQTGLASWYAATPKQFRTADGESLSASGMTAAHPSLPMQTLVRVTNLANGRSIIVRINDRGPYVRGRVIDLTRDAAGRLDMIKAGLALVRLEVYDADQCTEGPTSLPCLRWKRATQAAAHGASREVVPAVMTARQ